VERRGAGRRMASRGEVWSVHRVLYPGVDSVCHGFDRHGLGGGVVLSGWRSGLCARVRWVWSGA
jgi:hypothetical protein